MANGQVSENKKTQAQGKNRNGQYNNKAKPQAQREYKSRVGLFE